MLHTSQARRGRASLRGAGGYLCPRCRYRVEALPPGELDHCPRHGLALVEARALADADGDPFLGRTIAGRFAVLELLGSGSMATVYRARHAAMRRDVAIKIVRSDRLLDAQAKRRFEREAHAMSLLASPHTATVFDFGEVRTDDDPEFVVDGSLYLAMELLEGESLGTRLKRDGPLTIADAVRFARHALSSLAEAHDKGIIHRDLKPDNLVLVRAPDGRAEVCKVLDFGIAKVLTQADGVDALETQAGTVFGTPRYMSPEQAQGKALDPRSDLYSLGVLLYHMLTGQPPYTDRDAVVVMAHHIKSAPKPIGEVAPAAEVPRGLEALVMRAMAKSPEDRPQSAGEFIQALDYFAADAGLGTGELTAVVALGPLRVPRRRLVQVAVGVVGLVLAAAGAAYYAGQAPPETAVIVGTGLSGQVSQLAEAVDSVERRAPAASCRGALHQGLLVCVGRGGGGWRRRGGYEG